MQVGKHLWIVNQYALKATEAGGTRHHILAGYLAEYGFQTTIIAGDRHYTSGEFREPERAMPSGEEDVRFVWIPVRGYRSNGLSRVLSMMAFSISVARWGLSAKSHHYSAPQIVLGSSPHLFGAFAAWLLSVRYRVPFVLEVRDVWPESLVALMGLSRRHPLTIVLSALEKFLYRRSAVVITLLEGVEAHVQSVAGKQAPKVIWVPNGVDVANLPKVSAQPNTDILRLVYTGAHGVANSLETLVEAARILRDEGSGSPGRFVFDLYGSGVEKGRLTDLAKRYRLDNVHFHAPVPKADIPKVLAAGDVLILTGVDTDLYRHGVSPNKLFDYLAAARPIVFSMPTPFDPVAAAGAGITVRPGEPRALAEAILALDGVPVPDRAQMGLRGRDYVERHHDSKTLAANLAAALLDV